jgi:uncharacterized SAM-binding protein YcdF (DUF218 family)
VIRRLSIGLFGLLLLWPAGLALFLAQTAIPAPANPTADGVVVLTGGGERVGAGLRLLQDNRAARLLISGVGHAASLREVAAAAGFDDAALPALASRVTLGRAADSTHGNALETADWVAQTGIRSLIVVTAYYHMPRALTELRRRVPGIVLIAYPVRPPETGDGASALGRIVSEYNKYLAVILGLEGLAARFGVAPSEHAG